MKEVLFMAKKTAKIDPKATAKTEVMAIVSKALKDAGYEVKDGVDYGMTKGTIVVASALTDIQIKPITPKTGIDRYEVTE